MSRLKRLILLIFKIVVLGLGMLRKFQFETISKQKLLYISKYLGESSRINYKYKNEPHFNYEESKTLVKHLLFSDRVNELSELIKGNNVIEIGCAEGLLTLRLAQDRSSIIGYEISEHRYKKALELKHNLLEKGLNVSNVSFINKDILSEDHIPECVDSIIAVRVLYHFRRKRDLDRLVDNYIAKCKYVLFVGDRFKAEIYDSFNVDFCYHPTKYFYFATKAGMHSLLARGDFQINTGVTSYGDPYVIGVNNQFYRS